MTKTLYWTGPDFAGSANAIPLPEGWSAATHEEQDEALAAEKVGYRIEGRAVYSATKPAPSPAPEPEAEPLAPQRAKGPATVIR